jgi:O-antigen/teichoic acid export membrane protein
MSATAKVADNGATLRRIRRVFSMGLVTNVLTLVTSFLLPPLFLKAIGAERYGQWLYLFTIPMSLAMFDLGVSAAFSTEVFKLHAQRDLVAAARTYHTGILLIGLLLLLVLGGAVGVIGWQHAHQSSTPEVLGAMLLLSTYVLVGFFSELLSSAYKCSGRYTAYQTVGLFSRVAETGAMLALIPNNDFALMAGSMLGIRLVTVMFTAWQAHRMAPELLQGSWLEWAPFKHLLLPSAMYAINPLIMFLALQVPLLIIGPAVSMAAVVAYTTTRTLARLPLQISSQISFSLYTEYTRLHGQGQQDMVNLLYRRSQWTIALLFAAYAAGGFALGPWAYELWLKHLPAEFKLLFLILLLDAVFESFMRNRVCLTSSMNQHSRDTLFQLVAVCTSVGTMFVVSRMAHKLTDVLWPAAIVTTIALMFALRGHRAPSAT